MKKEYIITIVVAIVVGAAAFFGGMKYQQSQRPSFGNGQFRNGGQAGGRGTSQNGGNRGGFRPVVGEIISSDDKSITVKMDDGSSKIVLLSETTAINKASTATKAELTQGTKVAVFGQDNSDGSVTAQNIQLNPMMNTRFGGQPSPTASSSQ